MTKDQREETKRKTTMIMSDRCCAARFQEIERDFPSGIDGFAIWESLTMEARREADRDPVLESWLTDSVLRHDRLEDSLGIVIGEKLFPNEPSLFSRELMEAILVDPSIGEAILADLREIRRQDPATSGYLTPFLLFKGFLALEAYRVAHSLWLRGRVMFALRLQSQISEVFGVDIHPAARIGTGVFIDHATGVVIGETAVIGNGVAILHGVTLGGTGKIGGDRHPKVGNNVQIGAGSQILGNIRLGDGSKIGAGSTVVGSVAEGTTVVGVAARQVKHRVVSGSWASRGLLAGDGPLRPVFVRELPSGEV